MSLYDHQKEALKALREMDKMDRFSTLVNVPTGGGKTRIAVEFCKEVLSRGKVLWMAGRQELLGQALQNFDDISCQLICSEDYKDYTSESANEIKEESDILFITTQTLANAVKTEEAFVKWLAASQEDGKKLYIVYDEAHHIGASGAESIFKALLTNEGYDIARFGLIGLTATVYRGDNEIDVFHTWFKHGWKDGQITYTDEAYGDDNSFTRCKEKGLLYANRIQPVDIVDLFGKTLIKPELLKVDEFDRGDLKPLEEVQYLADRISKNYQSWGKTVVYVSRGKMAKKLVELLKQAGVPAFKYTSPVTKQIATDDGDYGVEADSPKDIENEKNAFNEFSASKGSYKVLVVVQKLDEGIDIPDLNTIYMYEPTHSHIILRQRVGRVLRKPKVGTKEARVIWQKYQAIDGVSLDALCATNLPDKYQSDDEIEADINAWKRDKFLQLPAGMYKEPLELESSGAIQTVSEYHVLEILKLFSQEEVNESDSIGYYYKDEELPIKEEDTELSFDDKPIYVLDKGKQGYDQLWRVLNSDLRLGLNYSKVSSFEEYAAGFGVSPAVMLDDIKRVCFYLTDIKKSDMSGKLVAPRIKVIDDEIIKFCNWFFAGKLIYVSVQNTQVPTVTSTRKEKEIFDDDESDIISYFTAKYSRRVKNEPKQYTELLKYENEDYGKYWQYQELESLRTCMRSGAVKKNHIKKDNDVYAYSYLEDGVVKNARTCNRVLDDAKRYDTWLIATALVNIPNHIVVSKQDRDEYVAKILKVLDAKLISGKEEQAIEEFMMALGYQKDSILREQCRLTQGDVPRLLQYMVYEKIYRELLTMVNYDKQNCINKAELEDIRDEKFKFYGVTLADDLTPVEDVIYDYRPYLKVVPYYQGIKPEFLCRMANDIVQMMPNASELDTFVDGFGGSGAVTMNAFYKDRERKHVYNDLGIMNGSMYRCLVEDIDGFDKAIKGVFDKAFSDYEDSDTQEWFFGKYIDYIENRKRDLQDKELCNQCETALATLKLSTADLENEYIARYDEIRSHWTSELKDKSLEERLADDYPQSFDKKRCRSFEVYMHTFILKVSRIYNILVSEMRDISETGLTAQDVGLIFFFSNTLNHRHFYSDCKFNQLGKTLVSYREWLENGKSCFAEAKIEREDAIKLLGYKEHNKPSTVFYLDIPYESTDTGDYVPGWFHTNEFFDALSKCEGEYIVSSRCNVCVSDEYAKHYKGVSFKELSVQDISDEEILQPKVEQKSAKDAKKNKELIKFFVSFLSKGYKEYYEILLSKIGIEPDNIGKQDAKYILFPYTNAARLVDNDGKRMNFNAVSLIDTQYVERMLANTHYTNIPVEVMVTNADLSEALKKVSVYSKDGVYAVPTFKTGVGTVQYKAEPLVIAMEYDYFMRILLRLTYDDNYIAFDNKQSTKDIAAAFRKLYDSKRSNIKE